MYKNHVKARAAVILAVGLLPFVVAFSIPGRPMRSGQKGLKPPSELALLMREMTAFTDSTRKRLERGEGLLPYPAAFAAMRTAEPTDGKLDIERTTFDAFADHYMAQLKALYDAPAAERTATFNATVQACANCHTVACPGPLVRIKKMYAPLVPALSK